MIYQIFQKEENMNIKNIKNVCNISLFVRKKENKFNLGVKYMNSNQRNYEWNNNQHIPNDQMYQSHDEPCNCPQNMYDKPQQNQEMNYVSSYTSMENHMYEENQSYNEIDSYTENMGEYYTPVLPSESERFQTVKFRGSKEGRGLLAQLNEGPYSGYGGSTWCKKTTLSHQVANSFDLNDMRNYFIFFVLDNDKYIIASKANGEVLQLDFVDEVSIVTRPYMGYLAQHFMKNNLTITDFKLKTYNDRTIDACEHRIHSWAKVTTSKGDGGNVLFTANYQNINIPSLPNPIPLQNPRDLMSLDDTGVNPKNAPRSIQGSVLIPAIVVSDIIPIDKSIKESPYYVLTYKQYWHKSWSVLLEPREERLVTDVFGMYELTQQNMKKAIDISVGADYKLRFFDKSDGFKQQIYRGLNTLPSQVDKDLIDREITYTRANNSFERVRYVKYSLAYEFELTRMDGTPVAEPWVAYHEDTIVKTFPHNMSLLVDNLNLVRAGNSYDLSIYKTPFTLKDGQIYRKNEHNSRLYYETKM